MPQSLSVDVDNFTLYGFGNYERYREYRVVDNYGFNYGYAGASVDESWTYGDNGCNLTVAEGDGTLNSEGKFSDRYTTFGQPVPACSVNPSCVSYMTQTYNIDSRRTFSHSVTWSCENVQVGT